VTLIALVDSGSGNLRSAAKALERAASEVGAAARVIVTDEPRDVAAADRIVLPGQGAFADCRRGVAAKPGLEQALVRAVIEQKRPFFGICVGMQLMVRLGLEHGRHAGLGWLDGSCIALPPASGALKVPHMGWNELALTQPAHPVLRGLGSGDHVYFVHSYHVTGVPPDQVLATTDYGIPVVAMIGRDNLVGTQFHVEKSQRTGLALLANFCAWRP
jgi:imidazole glycerol-phosphate synthase subunit HisH